MRYSGCSKDNEKQQERLDRQRTYLRRFATSYEKQNLLSCILAKVFNVDKASIFEPRQANLCLRAFRHDKL